ncbi:hypothetical protein A2U01_0057383, partial [Trifolium medium]|nr:hypothetical protein [Trifolium medium]
QGASIKDLETQFGQVSRLMTNLFKTYAGSLADGPRKVECKAVKTKEKTQENIETSVDFFIKLMNFHIPVKDYLSHKTVYEEDKVEKLLDLFGE